MTSFQIASVVFAVGCLALLALVVVGTMRLFFRGSRTSQDLDYYLVSDEGNNNPPHIPVSHTFLRNNGEVYSIDAPELQKAKFDNAQTTTTKELNFIDR
jgi:hypothetical protein